MAAQTAAAQTVDVRSGEHGTFTRLVFDLPDETEWSLTPQRDDAYALSFGETGWEVDLSGAFDRIDRSRVARLQRGADGVMISLACPCRADGFIFQNRMLVVDISERSASDDARDGPAMQALALPPLSLPPRRQRREASAWHPLLPSFSPAVAPPGGADDGLADTVRSDVVSAAASGLLDPARRPVPRVFADSANDTPPGTDPDHRHDRPHAASGTDVSIMRGPDTRSVTLSGRACVPASEINILEWGGAGGAAAVMARTRAKLVKEFDRVDEDAVLAHARRLVHYGFGAEARAVIRMLELDAEASLIALTHLVDGQVDPARLFRGQTSCDGPAALWAALTHSESASGLSVDEAAILRAFEDLPDHLVRHLGPKLARRFIEMGLPELAREVLRRAERVLGRENATMAVLNAKLDANRGDSAEALRRLEPLIDAPGSDAPDALVASIEISKRSDRAIPEDRVALSAALSEEMEEAPEGAGLWRAHVLSLIATQDFDAARQELAAASERPRATRAFLEREFLRDLSERGTDSAFLKHALSASRAFDGVDPVVLGKAADRFMSLGVADAARDLIERIPPSRRERDATLLLSESLLALDRPREAEGMLIGLQGARAELLRARSRAMMGDHAFAADAFEMAGATEEARRATWLSGDLERLRRYPNDPLAVASGLAAGTESDPDASPLAAAEALSEDSAETRRVLEAVLDETRLSFD
jgi:hypothetical protein